MDAVERGARVHRGRTLHGARVDGVDRRVPVRIGAAPVRRDRRAGVSRSRTRAHADADGPPPDPHGGPRPRLQQRQHVRRAVALVARGTPRRGPVGGPVLRAGAQGERRGAGASMDPDTRRRLHLLVQRRALAVRGHHPIAARARARARARASPGGRAGRAGQPARRGCCSTRGRRPPTTSSTGAGRGRSTFAAPARTRACSTPPTARIAARARSRATRRSARGPAGWRGRCSASPSRSSFSRRCPPRRSNDAGGAEADAWMVEAARATCDFYIKRAACTDGVPYWDTGAPGLAALGDWGSRAADPFNDREPVDSSAAAIAAQGLLRLGHLPDEPRRGRVKVLAGRSARGRHALRRRGTVPESGSESSRAAAALGLSLAERLGSRAAGREHPARRVQPVGRLPRP